MDPDIGVFTLESAGILKRTDSLTIAAAQAPIRFNEYDFHGELYLPNPDKPELNIDPPAAEILTICGIASGFAFGYDPTGRSVFSI